MRKFTILTIEIISWGLLFVTFSGVVSDIVTVLSINHTLQTNEDWFPLIAIIWFAVALFIFFWIKPRLIRKLKVERDKKYKKVAWEFHIKDLDLGDIVTLDKFGDCSYDGYYDGMHLFAPVNKKLEDIGYVKLGKADAESAMTKVTTRDYRVKWEKPAVIIMK